jgi:PAS domain S-box-containing protein
MSGAVENKDFPIENTGPERRSVLLRNLYRSFLDNTFELIFRTSSADKIIFANKVFAEKFGYESYKKTKGSNMMILFEQIDVYTLFKHKALTRKKINNEIIHFKSLNGKRIVGLVNCQAYQEENLDTALNWTVLDITERMEHEESLRKKNEELEKVNTRMEKFLYSTSHDLRSPLTSIMGLTNLMKLETKDATLQEYLLKVEKSALKLDKIIHDLLGFSKTSYQRMKTRKVNLSELTWDIIDRYVKEPSFKEIHFEVNASEEFPFFSDHERLEIILDNIIRNAIHFYDANKTRPFIRVNIAVRDKEIQVEVLDNGIGIGKIHQGQIFNMFYKASTQSRGAGLGLYIVKDSIGQLHGSVSVESEIGFGSLFRVLIPNDHKGRLIGRKLQLKN